MLQQAGRPQDSRHMVEEDAAYFQNAEFSNCGVFMIIKVPTEDLHVVLKPSGPHVTL